MDRLHALARRALLLAAASALVGAGCEKEGGAPREAPADRFDTARAKPKKGVTVDELCDVTHAPGTGATLAWPTLSGAAPGGEGGWRWVNLWATWCKPCVEEIPLLRDFQRKMAKDGIAFELAFVSVDDDDAILARYRAAHPDAPAGPRLAKADSLAAFLTSVGLDPAAPIPVHIFVAPDDRVRCVRAGALREPDLAAVETVLRSR